MKKEKREEEKEDIKANNVEEISRGGKGCIRII